MDYYGIVRLYKLLYLISYFDWMFMLIFAGSLSGRSGVMNGYSSNKVSQTVKHGQSKAFIDSNSEEFCTKDSRYK